MIVDGRLPAGERLNEVHLAERLGVSRTPLREALNRLVTEGAIEARPGRGYVVKPLSIEEFEQLYALRPILDPAALRLAGLPSFSRISKLGKLNQELRTARGADAAIELDDAWHQELLAGCPNQILLELIVGITRRTRRYELALMREARLVNQAGDDHERILAALRARDLDAACAALERNLKSGRAPIVAWLRAREPKQRKESAR
ncbi:MAG: GntR family transcriptional regulator [Candidatus Eisenbacteria bacterium]|nr:GntR family transcriptional regulator [Candidatus Eisenbacteria bacterium]